MIFRQIIHDDLGCASYLVGDGDAGLAAVVNPRFEIDEYLELARYLGVRIEHVLETHTHADHVSGHGRLAEATGATIHVHRAAGAEYPHEPFDDGWELALGDLRVRAIHTPGHRPEHTAFALVNTARGDEPWAVLTGDSLFVGDVARPDLAVEREEGARDLFRSLKAGLLSMPPETEVWPGHLGGSMCGGPDMDQKISSTIGFELGHNPILSEVSEEGFVARALAGLGPAAAALRRHRRPQPRPAGHRGRPRRAAVGGPGRPDARRGGAGRGRAHRRPVRRRPRPRVRAGDAPALGLRHQAGLGRGARPGDRLHRPRRRRRAAGGPPGRVGGRPRASPATWRAA